MTGPANVVVFADPGLPSRTLARVLASTDHGRAEGNYRLSHNDRQIPLLQDGTLDVESVREWSRHQDAGLVVIITEIPRRSGKRPKTAELHFAEDLAIISLPALGWLGLPNKLRWALFDAVDALIDQQVPDIRQTRMRSGIVREQSSEAGGSVYIGSPWWRPGRLRLALGMVRTNEPLATVPKLSGVLAAATATGAFGVFFSTIWEMANALPPWRLSLITVSAIVAMVLWLLFANRLWERTQHLGSLSEAAMYNASTVTTLVLSVTILYLSLLAGIFITALVVIEADFMAQTIDEEVSVLNYANIAWLSASMGTVAGALGSNFDSEVDIRNLTHGRRQAQRYWQREQEQGAD